MHVQGWSAASQENRAGGTGQSGLEENLYRRESRRHQELLRRNGSGQDEGQRSVPSQAAGVRDCADWILNILSCVDLRAAWNVDACSRTAVCRCVSATSRQLYPIDISAEECSFACFSPYAGAARPEAGKKMGAASNSRPTSRKKRRDCASPILRARTARRKLSTNDVTIFKTPTSAIPENASRHPASAIGRRSRKRPEHNPSWLRPA